jgi:hypothetical protein
MVPSFIENYEALEKVKAFFYAQSVSNRDRGNILSLEKSYFQLWQNYSKKQKTMYDFFVKKKKFPGLIIFLHSSFVFSIPLKNNRSRFYCIHIHCIFILYRTIYPLVVVCCSNGCHTDVKALWQSFWK